MIPRVIHMIWMPGLDEMPENYRRCFDSWEPNNPGWKIVLWDRSMLQWIHNRWVFDEVEHPSVQSDVIRFELVLRFGGVYVDCDMECVRPIAGLIEGMDAFASMRNNRSMEPSGFGATHGHPWILDVLEEIMERRGKVGFNRGLDIDYPFATATAWHLEVDILPHGRLQGTRHGDRPEAYAYHHRFADWQKEETKCP